ncbi:MAG: response regulator, partial [Mucilaginibacter sp.]|nr:response regulator [Mucilaginibacter sp.]
MMYSRANLTRYFILIVLLFAGRVSAQLKCKIEHYSTEDGLSHDALTCMMKDKEGFMWFGTWDGINRFDGHNFVSYKSLPGDMSQLKNDRIDQIVEDQSYHLWLKAYDNQIYRFDKRSEQFLPIADIIHLKEKKKVAFDRVVAAQSGDIWLISSHDGLIYFPKNDTSLHHYVLFKKGGSAGAVLPSNTTRFFYEDRQHNIWIGTTDGLGLLAKGGPESYRSVSLEASVAKGLNFNSVDEDAHQMYFGTSDGQLVIYNKAAKKIMVSRITSKSLNCILLSKKTRNIYAATSAGEILTVNTQDGSVIAKAVNASGAFYSLYEDKKGVLWMTPEMQGVARFDPANSSFQYFSQSNDAKFRNGNHVRVFEDNEGIVWVSMKGGGFGYYDGSKIAYFYNEPGAANRQFSNIITDLYYDQSGILWLNTDDRGIDRIIFQRNDFNQHLMVDPGTFKSDNEVRGILCDHQNRLWIGAKSGKLYIYHNGKPVNGLFVNEPKEGIGQVYTMMQDRRGNIWLGTKTNGLFRAAPINTDGTQYKLSHYLADKSNINSISSNEIYALVEDLKGHIWVGSYDGGLNLVDGDGSSGKFLHTGPAFTGYPKGNFHKIRNMALDKSGNIWIATTDGLMVLDPDDRKSNYNYVTYSKIPGDKASLGNNDVQYIFRDSKDTMWLATSGGGLDQAVGDQPLKSLKFHDFTTKDGLPNDYVLSCTEDRDSNLWIATQNGLSKFNVKNRQFRNYDSYDGLPKAIFSEASCTRLPNFNLVFGTVKGYLVFDPKQITNRQIAANLVFTNLQINNEDIVNRAADKLLADNINYSPGLTLKYDQNTISLDYAILDQRSGFRQSYAYRLKGFDVSWRNNKNQRRATYTNLPPGSYTLEVKSLNTGMYSNLPYRSLKMTILPPPWRTWWAYLIYGVLIIILAGAIRRIALTVLRLRHNIAVEKRLAALKMSFFTNVSHELRTPLTLILNPIEEIEKILVREKFSDKGAEYISVVKRNANRMVRFINQLLDLRKIQSGKMALRISEVEMVSFVTQIGSYFSDIAREKNIHLKIEAAKEVQAWIDAEKIDIVIYNILANAFKFTPAEKSITIKLAQAPAKGVLTIAICDEGGGVTPAHLSDIFELYYEGDHGDGKNLKGTGIGLALSKELVELHHGKISAQNNPDHGLTVTVEIRLGKDHFAADDVVFVDQPSIEHEHETTIEGSAFDLPGEASDHAQGAPLVLLVEDNIELRTFLKVQLSEYYRIETAENGAEGLRKAVELL